MAANTEWLSDKDYKYVYNRTPRVCVDLLVFYKNKFLLIKRGIEPFIYHWAFPGGRVFHGERIVNAIDRIVLKEVGVKCNNPEYFGFIEMPNDGKYIHTVSLVFLLNVISGKIKGDRNGGVIRAFDYVPDKMQPYQETFLKENWGKIFNKVSFADLFTRKYEMLSNPKGKTS